jgi:hypothetical protein
VWARDFAKVLTAPLLITQLALLGGLAPLDALVAAFAAGGASFSAAVANGFARRVSFRPAWLAWILVAIFWTAATFALVLIPGLTAARLRARTTRNLFVGLTVLVFL